MKFNEEDGMLLLLCVIIIASCCMSHCALAGGVLKDILTYLIVPELVKRVNIAVFVDSLIVPNWHFILSSQTLHNL